VILLDDIGDKESDVGVLANVREVVTGIEEIDFVFWRVAAREQAFGVVTRIARPESISRRNSRATCCGVSAEGCALGSNLTIISSSPLKLGA